MSIFSVAIANATWCCCWPTTVYIPLSLISWPAAGFTNHNSLSVCSSCFLRSVSLKFDEFLLWRINVFQISDFRGFGSDMALAVHLYQNGQTPAFRTALILCGTRSRRCRKKNSSETLDHIGLMCLSAPHLWCESPIPLRPTGALTEVHCGGHLIQWTQYHVLETSLRWTDSGDKGGQQFYGRILIWKRLNETSVTTEPNYQSEEWILMNINWHFFWFFLILTMNIMTRSTRFH